jgi:hypothetical protein
MNADGLSYLDLASEALNGGPSKLVNAYWSPGYPALIGIAMFLFRPSSSQEFALIHFVNFLIFGFALWPFSRFLGYWLKSTQGTEGANEKPYLMPFAFSAFLWFTLELVGLEPVTPDLCVAAIVFLAAGISCRLSLPGSSWKQYVTLGVVLAAGYYFKAVMLPLGVALLVLLFFLLPLSSAITRQKLFPRLSLSLLVLLLAAAPMLTALSVQAHRLSFGASGWLNYAWTVNGLQMQTGWTGGSPDVYGIPKHAPRKLMVKPLILEFDTPVKGTYPLWYDPSYWYAGAKARFGLRQQVSALGALMRGNGKDVLSQMTGFISGGIVLWVLVLREKIRPTATRILWWQLAWPLSACAMYGLVIIESRYVGGFLVLFWLAIYGALFGRVDRRVGVAVSATVICTVMIPFAAELAMVSVHAARDMVYPRPSKYQIGAIGLGNLGLRSGDRLAIVGYGLADLPFYARQAGLRVAAQIPDADEFWRLSVPELESVAERLGSIGVKAVVVLNRPNTSARADWKDVKVSATGRLCVLLTSHDVSGAP